MPTTDDASTLAGRYARFVAPLEWAQVPEHVRSIALELFADWFANAAAGAGSPLALALRALVSPHPGTGGAPLAGDLALVDPLGAALVNAAASHANEFDDSYRAGLYHPGAPVASAAFAAAFVDDAPGTRLLTALVAGYELTLRLAAAINPAHYKVWHTTGTVGAFGAAAAAASVLGLDVARAEGALGLAGTQAAGLWEVLPDAPVAKNLHPAKAAHAGLLAALLARGGVAGPSTILEGPRGFFAATVPAPVDPRRCVDGLGERWLTPETTFKAYPTCGHAMTSIEATLRLRGRADAAAVEDVEVRTHPVSIAIAGEPFPADEASAKFSIPYCVAVALLDGRVGQAQFSAARIGDPAVHALLRRVRLVADESLAVVEGQRPSRVTLTLAGGARLVEQADVRTGDPEQPMSAAQKRDKCLGLMETRWGARRARDAFDAISALPAEPGVRGWAQRLREAIDR